MSCNLKLVTCNLYTERMYRFIMKINKIAYALTPPYITRRSTPSAWNNSVYLVSATNSGNVLRYAVPYLDHTTLGCKEVLVQFLSPCLVMFLLSCSEIGNPQYVYNIKAWDGEIL